MTIRQKVKVCCEISGITLTDLAKKMGMSQQSMTNRLATGKFHQDELEKMAEILGCEYTSSFTYPDGTVVK